jgi:hypothetical protein
VSAFFASMESKPAARPYSGVWQAKRLQRKCACGGSWSGGCHCGGTRAQAESAPAMHDFSRMSVHTGSDAPLFLAELSCLGRVPEDAGDTGCDVEKGVPDIVIHAPSLCYRHCTERHEEVHRKDLGPCCKKAHAAWDSAKSDDRKKAVQDKMNNWVESNADWLQCRAYAESVRCADEFLVAHCGAKKAEAETGKPGQDSPRRAEDEAPKMAGGPIEVPGEQVRSRVAEDAAPKDQPQVKPELCCYTVKEYRRKSDLRREAFCKEGNKGPKPCPF